MINLIFSFFLFALSTGSMLLAMDPPRQEYLYYIAKAENGLFIEGVYRSPLNKPVFEWAEHQHSDYWLPLNFTIQVGPTNYYFEHEGDNYYLQAVQQIGNGGSYKPAPARPNSPTPLRTNPAARQQKGKLALPKKDDLRQEQDLIALVDEFSQVGFSSLAIKTILHEIEASQLKELLEVAQVESLNLSLSGSGALETIIILLAEKKPSMITLNIYNSSTESLLKLAKTLKNIQSQEINLTINSAELSYDLICEIAEIDHLRNLHFHGPFDLQKCIAIMIKAKHLKKLTISKQKEHKMVIEAFKKANTDYNFIYSEKNDKTGLLTIERK